MVLAFFMIYNSNKMPEKVASKNIIT